MKSDFQDFSNFGDFGAKKKIVAENKTTVDNKFDFMES